MYFRRYCRLHVMVNCLKKCLSDVQSNSNPETVGTIMQCLADDQTMLDEDVSCSSSDEDIPLDDVQDASDEDGQVMVDSKDEEEKCEFFTDQETGEVQEITIRRADETREPSVASGWYLKDFVISDRPRRNKIGSSYLDRGDNQKSSLQDVFCTKDLLNSLLAGGESISSIIEQVNRRSYHSSSEIELDWQLLSGLNPNLCKSAKNLDNECLDFFKHNRRRVRRQVKIEMMVWNICVVVGASIPPWALELAACLLQIGMSGGTLHSHEFMFPEQDAKQVQSQQEEHEENRPKPVDVGTTNRQKGSKGVGLHKNISIRPQRERGNKRAKRQCRFRQASLDRRGLSQRNNRCRRQLFNSKPCNYAGMRQKIKRSKMAKVRIICPARSANEDQNQSDGFYLHFQYLQRRLASSRICRSEDHLLCQLKKGVILDEDDLLVLLLHSLHYTPKGASCQTTKHGTSTSTATDVSARHCLYSSWSGPRNCRVLGYHVTGIKLGVEQNTKNSNDSAERQQQYRQYRQLPPMELEEGSDSQDFNPDSGADEGDIASENRQLQRRLACILCRENSREVVFRPCCHLVCCLGCSYAVQNCPLCHQLIRADYRVFM